MSAGVSDGDRSAASCTRSRWIRRKPVPARGRAAAGHPGRPRRAGAATSGCEIGFAQDPDGDRLAVVDENGRVLDNDDVLALAVDAALRPRCRATWW